MFSDLSRPTMNDEPGDSHDSVISGVTNAFEAAWREFGPPTIKFYLRDVPPDQRQAALIELVRVDLAYRLKLGQRPSVNRYIEQFPRVFPSGSSARGQLVAIAKEMNAAIAAAAAPVPDNVASEANPQEVPQSQELGVASAPEPTTAAAEPYSPATDVADADDHPLAALQTAASIPTPPLPKSSGRRNPATVAAAIVVTAIVVILSIYAVVRNEGDGHPKTSTAARDPELKPEPPRPSTKVPSPVEVREIDLLKLIDVEADAPGGVWSRTDGALDSDDNRWAMLRIPYAPPEEYDLEVEFERLPGGEGGASTGLIGSVGDVAFEWNVWLNPETSAIWSIDGRDWPESPPEAKGQVSANAGGRHVSRLSVRRDGVEGYLDGVRVAGWKTDFRDMSLPEAEHWRGPVRLGLRTYANPTRFYSVKLVERSGPGRALRP